MKKYYLDACIWIDYFENRKDRFRPLGEWAHSVIRKTVEKNNFVILSDYLIRELKRKYSSEEVLKITNAIPKALQIITKANETQAEAALKLKKKHNIPFGDALHAVIAKDHKAVLITRDTHLEKLKGYTQISKPEELI